MKLDIITADDAQRMAARVKGTPEAPPSIAERGSVAKPAPQVSKDDLYVRLLKYIPAPLIGIYLMVINVILGAAEGTTEKVLAWIIFGVFALLIVLYLLQRKIHRYQQLGLSLVAFVAWSMASPGPFQLIPDWKEYFGTVALAVVAAILIVFQPAPLPDDVINETVT